MSDPIDTHVATEAKKLREAAEELAFIANAALYDRNRFRAALVGVEKLLDSIAAGRLKDPALHARMAQEEIRQALGIQDPPQAA